jgi:hypothetical protein
MIHTRLLMHAKFRVTVLALSSGHALTALTEMWFCCGIAARVPAFVHRRLNARLFISFFTHTRSVDDKVSMRSALSCSTASTGGRCRAAASVFSLEAEQGDSPRMPRDCNNAQAAVADYTSAIELWGGGRGPDTNPYALTFRGNALAYLGR